MTWLYIWLGVTALALILEFITTDLVSIWFAGGGLVAMLLAGLGVELYIHLPVFIVVSFAMMLCFRKMVMRRFNVGGTVSNTEAVIGKEVKLITGISFGEPGSIKINDVVWTAIADSDKAEIAAGTIVRIKDIRGNKYIVEEANGEK